MKPFRAVIALLFSLPLAVSATAFSDVLIDSFDTAQTGGVGDRNVADGIGIIGGERDINTFILLSANGAVPGQLQLTYPTGLLTSRVGGDITYDGPDHDASSSYFGGLGSVDLTQGGVNNCFQFDITSVTGTSGTLSIQVRSVNHGSSVQVNLPPTPGIFDVPFSLFSYEGAPFANPADFQNVGYINLHFEMNDGDSVVMNSVIATTVPEPSALALITCVSGALLNFHRKRAAK